MAADTLSRRALLEAKRDDDVAPRMKVWPPKGYVPPTAEEFAELLRAAHRYSGLALQVTYWKKVSDEQVQRRLQLVEVAGTQRGRDDNALTGYTRALRDEARKRGLVHRSIAVLRCEACSHATERLFEATQGTHPGLENRSGTRIPSAWFCARCWSGCTLGDIADGLADEDGTEDEE